MTDQAPCPAPIIPSSLGDDDLIFTISHALLYRGRRRSDAEVANLGAKILAERVLDALRQGYEIRPKPLARHATAEQHQPMPGIPRRD